MSEPEKIRLNKRLVQLGFVNSRRAGDELISSGKVRVGGKTINNLATTVTSNNIVSVTGRGAKFHDSGLVVALNKPVGYICSHAQQGDSPTIFSLLPRNFAHLKIAGRLDKDSSGLVILSSDGDLVQKLSHPSTQKPKEYVVGLDKPLAAGDQKRLVMGVKLNDGISKFDSLSKITSTRWRLSLHEGRNRQIRRTLADLGYTVKVLERVSLGGLSLSNLGTGKHKIIKPNEVL
ncbi:rRNA pseudouridine synthase [Candidatus Saccharibacteria bacterium]|nr:rRNA pseudouridine synthase [Candidatus Saccharibacteria bacterium]